ncbi:YbjN domain-containing protein [Micromonospora sp. WMMD980]|uniref:YbjN domain-containing protein n=1 Tax=Micromonospora sp. WMMD980 TaxID=3016088 RepID=UPI002415F964|nr:YbjN domain-containing protein [Micromonospora sp. WMMD980]MDG4802251.1 YbjN domain-containing protein [Micromonospora sp. WMMD980]
MASPEIEDGPDGPLAGPPQALRPLTGELIAAVLTHRGYAVVEEPDGALVGRWERSLVWFHRRGAAGEQFQVRTVTAPRFGIERVPELHAFCNTWNHDRLWPKAYVHVADDGTAQVCGEVTTDLERGVTPHQLDRLVDCGVTTGCQLADAVAELTGGPAR